MLTPTSRLGDDLYLLYLACMSWFLFPFYGEAITTVLPSEWDHFDAAFDIAVIGAGLLATWSGVRGGPLMITRAVIVNELGSPASKRQVLLPWLVRQTTAWAMAAAVFGAIGLALADKTSFGYRSAFIVSIASILATWFALFLATGWMVAMHRPRDRGPWIAINVGLTAAPAIAALAGLQYATWIGVAALGVLALVASAATIIVLNDAPVEPLWRRASAVESMRSSMQNFDFQRVFLDLRNATEQPPFSTGHAIANRRMPTPVWRHVAAVQHTLGWHLSRLAVFAAIIAGLFWAGDPSQGIVTLALAGVAFLLGLELAGAVAATADQLTFVVHYPRGSARILRGQVALSAALAVLIGLAVTVGRVGNAPRAAVGVVLLCAAGALGATVQARLGSPDIAAYLDKYGALNLSKVLWARALIGPAVVLTVAVAGFHQFLRPDPVAPALTVVVVAALVGGFVISTRPLEHQLAKGSS